MPTVQDIVYETIDQATAAKPAESKRHRVYEIRKGIDCLGYVVAVCAEDAYAVFSRVSGYTAIPHGRKKSNKPKSVKAQVEEVIAEFSGTVKSKEGQKLIERLNQIKDSAGRKKSSENAQDSITGDPATDMVPESSNTAQTQQEANTSVAEVTPPEPPTPPAPPTAE